MSQLRKPSELTDAELAYCQDCLPRGWFFDHEGNALVNGGSRRSDPIEMKYIKLLTDYLTSINVEPYGE